MMPHTNRKPVSANGFKPAQFVNPNLTDDDRARVKAAPWDLQLFELFCEVELRAGYKLTIRFDEQNDCYAAWLVPPDRLPNKGYILAGRGSTPSKAVKQLGYAHIIMYERDWTEGGMRETMAIDD